MKLIIKKAVLADAETLSEILTQAMRYKLSLGDTAWGTEPYTPEELYAIIEKGHTYSAWSGSEIVGTLILLMDDEMTWGKQPGAAAYVHQLAIKDGCHGQGVGKQLLEWAGQKARHEQKEFLRIDFPPSNRGLKHYYERAGFTWVMDREIHAPHSVYKAALYERLIK